MAEQKLVETFNKALDALFNQPEKIADYFADDILWINYVPDHLPYGGEYRGLEGVNKLFSQYVEALDVGRFEFDEFFVAENNVLIVTGKECHSTVKATGKQYSMSYVFVVRFNEEGKICYFREHNDTYEMAEAFKA